MNFFENIYSLWVTTYCGKKRLLTRKKSLFKSQTWSKKKSRNFFDCQKLFDFPESGNIATLGLCFNWVFEVHPILEPDQVVHQLHSHFVQLLIEDVITVPECQNKK